MRSWWAYLCLTAPRGIGALWFGLTELVVDGARQRHLYVAGCSRFDPDDSAGDWAAAPYVWWPNGRYISPNGLAAVPGSDNAAALEYAASLVRTLRPQDVIDVKGVAVGFDDGDFVITWPEAPVLVPGYAAS